MHDSRQEWAGGWDEEGVVPKLLHPAGTHDSYEEENQKTFKKITVDLLTRASSGDIILDDST